MDDFKAAELLLCAAMGTVVCGIALWLARSHSERNWVMRRAPALTIAQLNPGDDAWITGHVLCDRPLTSPQQQIACVFFERRVEVREIGGRSLSRQGGRLRYKASWKLRKADTATVDFRLEDGTGSIPVDDS